MNREETIRAIEKAENVFVHVRVATSYAGSTQYSQSFRVPKAEVIATIRELDEAQFEPNIEISGDGATVTIGKERSTPLAENFSHFENNNGNF